MRHGWRIYRCYMVGMEADETLRSTQCGHFPSIYAEWSFLFYFIYLFISLEKSRRYIKHETDGSENHNIFLLLRGGTHPKREGNGWAVKMTSGVEWSAISAFTRGEKPSLLSCPQTFPPFLLLSSGPSLILVHFFFFFLPLPPLFQLFSRSMTEATRQKWKWKPGKPNWNKKNPFHRWICTGQSSHIW
jgi:hypothetical protein